MTDNPTEITTVCYVRAPLLLEPVDAQVETLQACESEGAVDDLLLRSWPKEVALSEESPHQEVLENFERFAQWADERGVSVRPPFRKRTTTSQVTGTTRERLVTPLLCLELYADDELIGVSPHERVGRGNVHDRRGDRHAPNGRNPDAARVSQGCGRGPRVGDVGYFAPTAAAL